MPKFGTKEKRVPTKVNDMGEKAYSLSPKEELVSTVLTTFLSDSYYEKDKTIINRILSACEKVEPEFIAKLALYTRKEANMRSSSHLLAGYLGTSKRISGKNYASSFYENICLRPDDASEILAYYQSTKHKAKMPNAMRRGFKAYLEKLSPYTIDKYKMKGRKITLKDLANICHIVPPGKSKEAWRRLFNNISLEGLYTDKILNKEQTKLGKIENVLEREQAEAKVYEDQLSNPSGMPIFALLRNLVNILEKAPHLVDEACKQLTDKKKVLNSKLLPFRFATAYAEVEKVGGSSSKSKVVFEKATSKDSDKEKVLKAIETALELSTQNIPTFQGTTAILVDHSGSVRGGGSVPTSKVSPFSTANSAMIGNLFATLLMYAQDNVYLGLFGDRLIKVDVNRTTGLLKNNSDSFKLGEKCGGATENGLYIFLKECIDNKVRVDNLVIFSDMVIGSGGRGAWDGTSRAGLGTFQELFKKFKQINPQCLTVCVDIRQSAGTSVFDRSLNILQVAGWSDKIFDQISGQSLGYTEIIKTIESIKL